ncbi:hypothetical protein MPTA5024_37365 [Microbispora sp. ATCC PTA-5024]|nr:hypothetical protein MPTA5024_37365 [Microbispora sp. ATCC PTA-5024]
MRAAVTAALLSVLMVVPAQVDRPIRRCAPEIVVADPSGQEYRSPGVGSLYALKFDEYGPPRVRAALTRGQVPVTPEGPLARADIDGDGCEDLVVGSPHVDAFRQPGAPAIGAGPGDDGLVQILWGGPGDSPGVRDTTVLPAPEAGRRGHFGWSVAAAKGLVAVGAPHEDAPGAADSGAVYLFRLSGREVRDAPRRITQDSPGVPGNGEAGDAFGWSLALAELGGLTGVPELVVGAPYEDDDGAGRQQDGQGVPHAGAVTLLADVTTAGPTRGWRLSGPSAPGARYGYALATGEGDGPAYLAASAPGVDAVDLYEVTPGGEPRPVLQWRGTGAFGFSLALGYGRLAVGAPYGGTAGTVTALPLDGGPATTLPGSGAGDRFGWAVAWADDGWLLVGAPDRGTTGAVALVPLGGGERIWLAPGDGFVPSPPSVGTGPRFKANEHGVALDFGASMG